MNSPEWLKPGLYGAAIGAVLVSVVGFTWGGWVTSGTSNDRAMAMARVAGLHAAGADVAPFNPNAVIAAVYSEPQVAQVGIVASEDGAIQTTRVAYSTVMKAHLLSETEGFVELAYDQAGRVTGGLAVGPHAGDVLAPVALAIQVGASLNDLAAIFAAHPTLSELAFAAARQA